MSEEMSEEMYGIETEYNPKMTMVHGDPLTAALFEYLKHRGFDVVKVSMPMVKYDGQLVGMRSFLLSESNDMSVVFDDVYQNLIEMNTKTVLLYMMKMNYMFGKSSILEGSELVDVEEEPTLKHYGVVRLGVIPPE